MNIFKNMLKEVQLDMLKQLKAFEKQLCASTSLKKSYDKKIKLLEADIKNLKTTLK